MHMSVAVMSAIGSYALVSLVQIILDEVYALWCVAPVSQGGLAFSSRDVGTSLSFVGVMILVVQLALFPHFHSRHGLTTCYKVGFLVYGLTMLFLPHINSILLLTSSSAHSTLYLWLTLLLTITVRVIASSFVFTCCMIFVNNAGKEAGDLGIVNGVSQCTVSFVRTLGPVLGGSLWSWSLLGSWGYPWDFHFVFYVLAVLCFGGFCHGHFVLKS
jgi:hypothetical protein